MRKLIKAFIVCLSLIIVISGSVGAVSNGILQANELLASKQVANIETAIVMLEGLIEETAADDPYYGDLLWTTAKGYLYLGDRSPGDQKLELFETGKAYAEQGVSVIPNSPDAHFWSGALIGKVGQTKGILNSLFMIKPLKASLDRVLEIDSQYARAYFALSQLYLQAPGWPLSIGDKKLALENAERSVELDPDDPEHLVQLARVLIESKRKDEAKALLDKALASPEMEIDELLKNNTLELVETL